MIHRKPTSELLLIGLIAFIFLLAAAVLFLLQRPSTLPPVAVVPSASQASSSTPGMPLPVGASPTAVTPGIPAARTSYTPFATRLTLQAETTGQFTPTGSTPGSPTLTPDPRTPSPTPTPVTPYPGVQPSPTTILLPGTPSPTATNTSTPTFSPTATLAAGEFGISGRVTLNGVPVAGVTVSFRDDQPSRSAITDSQGRYWFTTYAIGVDFLLSYEQAANPQVTPATSIASAVSLYGYLPSGTTLITLPDLEISLVIAGQSFEPTTPLSGATFSVANITAANPIQFVWTTYNQAQDYYIELCQADNDAILWGSENTTSTNVMFDGILDDSTHITAGSYNWYVAANRVLNDYTITVYTQPRSLVVIP
jgi:hypothetical protein